MAANTEVDQMMRKAMRLLHSTHPSSATELRQMLDEVLKQRCGPEKMLCNTLSQKHLDEETHFPGVVTTPPPQQPQQGSADEVINLTNSPAKTISDSPDTIVDSDDGLSGVGGGMTGDAVLTGEDDGNLKEFGDLNCCVCGEMMFTATNRLIECSSCGTLYHQDCHKPPITEEEASEDREQNWQCDTCFNKPSTSRAAGIVVIPDEPLPLVSAKTKSSATSSSSSNSSSPFYKQEQASKGHHKSSTSSKSQPKEERSSSKSVLTPAINVISAADKSSRKSSSSHSSSKSSKSSKHHESSSKRKSNK